GIFIGLQKSIDSPDIGVQRLPALVVLDLYLITATQVNPAIAPLLVPELRMQFEVLELLVADQVGTRLGAGQDAILYDPLVLFPIHLPSTEIFSVEQRDGPVPFWVRGMGQLGGPLPGPRNYGPVGIDQGPLELAIDQGPVADHIAALGFPLVGDRKGELVLPVRDNLGDGPGTAKGENEAADQGGIARMPDFQPGRGNLAHKVHLKVPTSLQGTGVLGMALAQRGKDQHSQ